MSEFDRPEAALVERDVLLGDITSLAVGGPARYFAVADQAPALDQLWAWSRKENLPVLFLGHGTNVLFPDSGFDGLVIRNAFLGRELSGCEVAVGGAEPLSALIRVLNQNQLSGMEKMYGIPGTVAGAVVGNAGAYGQEIADSVREVRVWTPSGIRTFGSRELRFDYRHSRFKEEPGLFLMEVRLRLRPSPENLQAISDDIYARRLQKYPEGLRCPGSYFKNVLYDRLSPAVRRRIPLDYVEHGKIPAGKLLESVEARGLRRGGAGIAAYHGNLFVNYGNASTRDILWLAETAAERVRQKFGIALEPEVLVIPDRLRSTEPHEVHH